MNREQTIPGYRVLGEPPKNRSLSYDYLQLGHEAARAEAHLRQAVTERGANCVGKEEFFSGETLPSERDAALACAGCPAFRECEVFLKLGGPGWGLWAGRVVGRGLMEDIENDFEGEK